MEPTTPTPLRVLEIENENNKFSCRFFCQITLAPPADGFVPDIIGKEYFIMNGQERIVVRLKYYATEPYATVFSAYTLPCSGLDEWEWKKRFMEKYPNTTAETKIAIYCYERIAN